jgi:heme/copper-type cytochrome/quinol oxidase subunit 3
VTAEPRKAIDVSRLPTFAFGHRDPLWWGVAGLVAIEGTMVALLAASYLYVRGNFEEWPPAGFGQRVQTLAAIEVAVLLASTATTHLWNESALRGHLRGLRLWGTVTTALGALFVALRFQELSAIPFRWDLNAYASTVWAILGLNTLHAVSGVGEDAALTAVAWIGPLEKKHLVDTRSGSMLWYFVVASWVPVYALVYLAPGLLRR